MSRPQHLLALEEFTREELYAFIRRAIVLKQEKNDGEVNQYMLGKTVALVFDKLSTRTRVSFEAATNSLGGQVIFLSSRDTQLARSEPLKDMARVMSRYVDALVVRTYGQEIVEELAAYSSIPVINALTDLYHPCQVLSDMMTVVENKGDIAGCHVAWIGDGNNMANTWIQAAAKIGFPLTVACPEGYDPDSEVLARAREISTEPITIVRDPREAVKNADVINTDVWASMGDEIEAEERLKKFAAFQVNSQLLKEAPESAIVMHCLPAHRDEEITEEVLESPQSVVWDQAENKMHIHAAILEIMMTAE